MKQMKSFRLNPNTVYDLESLSKEKGMSQAEIIEKAVHLYWFIQSVSDDTLETNIKTLRKFF